METRRHQSLKLAAASALRSAGFCAIAAEVSCPFSRYRIDVAGYSDESATLPKVGGRPPSITRCGLESFQGCVTAIIECKQSRADFLRDSRHLERLLDERRRLNATRRELEDRIIRPSEPHLAGSDNMLFAELESWDFSSSRLPSYRKVLRELRRIDQQIHGQTKFWSIARYVLADLLLVATPRGMISVDELPPGWGWMEVDDAWFGTTETETGLGGSYTIRSSPADRRSSSQKRRMRLLRNIAAAATRDAWRDRLPISMTDSNAAQAPADSPTA